MAILIDTQAVAGSTAHRPRAGGSGGPANHNGDVDFKNPVLLCADTKINALDVHGATQPVHPNGSGSKKAVDSQQNAYWGLTANTAGDVFFNGVVGAATNGKLGWLQTDIDPSVDPSILTTAGPTASRILSRRLPRRLPLASAT